MNTVIEQKYEDFLSLEIYFNKILTKRIDRWIELHKEKLFLNEYSYSHQNNLKTYKSDDFIDFNNNQYDNNYEYLEDSIECSYEIYYSGCGVESRNFNIDLKLITTEENNLEDYYLEIEKEIKDNNLKILLKQTTSIKNKKTIDDEKNLNRRRKEYEKLKKEFGGQQ